MGANGANLNKFVGYGDRTMVGLCRTNSMRWMITRKQYVIDSTNSAIKCSIGLSTLRTSKLINEEN